MTTDATTVLIQRIKGQLSPNGASALQSNVDQLNQFSALIANAASYAQILSTASGPAAQAISSETLSNIASQAAIDTAQAQAQAASSTATQAAIDAAVAEEGTIAGSAAAGAALAGAGTAGAAAAIVIFISFTLAAIISSSDSGSSETFTLKQIQDQLKDIENIDLAAYWGERLSWIYNFWDSATGGLGTDLDNLANEGIRGTDVKHDVSNFHDHAIAFVSNLVPSKNPINGETYWERPFVQSQEFLPQGVPYWYQWVSPGPGTHWLGPGWYGPQPQPQPGPPLGGSGRQMVADPRTALPFLLLGLSSYLIIESLLNVIDSSQPKFNEFLTEFKDDLRQYASFLFSQYKLAVNGIVKSDIPSDSDASTFIFWHGDQNWAPPWDSLSNAQKTFSDFAQETAWPTAGYAWNGVYGAVNEYPQYGAYQAGVVDPIPSNLRIAAYGTDVPYGTNLATIPVPVSSPGCIIDIFNADTVASEIIQRWQSDLPAPVLPPPSVAPPPLTWFQQTTLSYWTLPSLHTKVVLGVMARWKALYLINGYDKVWSFLQNLRTLSNLPPLPAVTLDQDRTIADGNWSARELCRLVSVAFSPENGFLPNGGTLSTYWPPGSANWTSGLSLFALTEYLDGVARGNWAVAANSTRPLGLRNRLAAVAVESLVPNPEP